MSNVIQLKMTASAIEEDRRIQTAAAEAVIALSDLRFGWKRHRAPILDIEGLVVEKGARLFIDGPSGCGKSTLLGLLAGIMTPQRGRVSILRQPISDLSGPARDRFRADHIGVIFQMFNLIPYLSLVENATLPCRFSRQRRENARRSAGSVAAEARRLLARLDMDHPGLISRPVTELSVGQQQRVAAARALIGGPEIVIADEPTSSLDADHRHAFIRLLFEECQKAQSTLIFVSHDSGLAPLFGRSVRLGEINRAGRVTSTTAGEGS